MKCKINLYSLALVCGLFIAVSATANSETQVGKHVKIALKTDDFELAETDISHLQVGESESIVTASGKIIDLLRTENGVEVYVDGELLDIGDHGGQHVLHVDAQVECITETVEECDSDFVFISDGSDAGLGHTGEHEEVIHKTVTLVCTDEDECEKMVWVSANQDLDFDELHEAGGKGHKVIRIHKIKDASTQD